MTTDDTAQFELMIGGSGGQGVLLIGKLLAEAALSVYENTLFFPNYGAQMRAGPSECTVIFSNDEISSPALLHPPVGISLDRSYLEVLGKRIRSKGVLLTDAAYKGSGFSRDDLTIYYLPATEKALEYGSLQSVNFLFIGAYLGLTQAVSMDVMENIIADRFKGGKNEALIPANHRMLREGGKLIDTL